MATPAAVLNIMVVANTAGANSALAGTQGQLARTTRAANSTSTAVGTKLTRAAGMATKAVGVGLVYGLYKGARAGMDFEKQMDSLGAVAGANAKEMEKLQNQALKFGQKTAFSAGEAAQAQTELAKGGLKVKDILGGALSASLNLAAAGELELADAAETTVNAMKLFDLQGKDSAQVADMLATAANTTTADVADFAMALKQSGGVAKTAGLDLNQTVTALEALAESGVKNSDAGTSLKTTLIQLLKPTSEQASMAKKLGIEWINQSGTMKSMSSISKELQGATKGMTQAERAKTFAVLAGTDGFRTLAALYDAGPAKLNKLTAANKKQGTAEEIAAKKMDNTAGSIEQLMGSLETLAIKGWLAIGPAVRKGIDALTSGVNTILDLLSGKGQLTAEQQKFADSFKGLGEDIGQMLEDLRPVFEFIGDAASRAFQGIKDNFGGVIDILRGLAQFISGVLTLDLGKAWDGITKIFGGAFRAILGTLRTITAPFRELASRLGGFLVGPIKWAWEKIKDIFGFFTTPIRTIIGFVKDHWPVIKHVLFGPFEAIAGFVKNVFGKVKDVIVGVFNFIKGKVEWMLDKLHVIKDLADAITPDVGSVHLPGQAGSGGTPHQDAQQAREGRQWWRKHPQGANLPHGQHGGFVTPDGIVPVQFFSRGGMVGGAGSKDTVPAMLQPGELVVPKKIVDTTKKNAKATAKVLTGELGKGYKKSAKTVGDFVKDHKGRIEGMRDDTGDSVTQMQKATDSTVTKMQKSVSSDVTKMAKTGANKAEDMRKKMTGAAKQTDQGVSSSFNSMSGAVAQSLKTVEGLLNKALDALGVKGVSFGSTTEGGGKGSGGGKGGGGGGKGGHKKQRGGPIGGIGTGDKVPAWLEPGEYVLNRNLAKHIGKRRLDEMNFGNIARFQKGGAIPAGWTPGTPAVRRRQHPGSTWDQRGGAPWAHLLEGWSPETWGFAGGYASSVQDLWEKLHGGWDNDAFLSHLEKTEGNWWSKIPGGYKPGPNYAISGMAGYDWTQPGITNRHGKRVGVSPGPPLEGKGVGYFGWGKKGHGSRGFGGGYGYGKGAQHLKKKGGAKGGGIPGYQTGGMQPAISSLIHNIIAKFGGSMTSGYRPGDPGFHGRGMAADWAGGDWTGASSYVNSIGPQLLEGIHQAPPGKQVSWDSGHQVSPSFWGASTWAAHVNHIHMAIANAVGAIGKFAGAQVEEIKRVMITGPDGPMKDLGQAAVDKVRDAANKKIAESAPMGGGLAGSVATGPIQQMARQMVEQMWGGGQWPSFVSLEMAEAGWNPRALNASSGAAGLAQALPASKYPPGAWPYKGLESAKLQLQWMMGYIKERYGSPSAAWAFHQSHNWYQRGGSIPSFGDGGVVPGPMGMPMPAIVHGGEMITPPGRGGAPPVIELHLHGSARSAFATMNDVYAVVDNEMVEFSGYDRQRARMGR